MWNKWAISIIGTRDSNSLHKSTAHLQNNIMVDDSMEFQGILPEARLRKTNDFFFRLSVLINLVLLRTNAHCAPGYMPSLLLHRICLTTFQSTGTEVASTKCRNGTLSVKKVATRNPAREYPEGGFWGSSNAKT